jgi:cell division protein FtsB
VSGPVLPPRPRIDGALAMSDAAIAPSPRIAPRERERVTAPRPPLRLAAGGAATIAVRVGETAMAVSGSRTMDRLVRSRAWIMIIGFALIGIVAMQVSMLKLNSGIARAADTAATLQRSNQSLKGEISTLSSGDRIQALAAQRGFVMPQPADITYLRADDGDASAARAAQRMQAPDKAIAGPAGSLAADSAASDPNGAATSTQSPTDPVSTAPLGQAAGSPPAVPAAASAGAPTAPMTTDPGSGATAPVDAPAGTGGGGTGTASPAGTTGTATAAGGATPQTGVTP